MTNKNKSTLWNWSFIHLLILMLFQYSGITIVNSTVSIYAVEHLNASPGQISLLSSLTIISALFFRPVAGFLIDRFGRRISISISLALTALLTLAMMLPRSIIGLGLLRFLMGIPFSMNTIGSATLRTDLIPEEKRVEGFNISSIAIMFSAMVVGPNLAFWILDKNGFGLLYPIAALLLIFAIATLLLFKFEDIKTKSNRLALNDLFEPRVKWFALTLGLTLIGWAGIMTFGPLYSAEIGLSFTGYFFLALGVGLIISQFIAIVVLADDKSPALTAVSLILVIIGHAVIGFIQSRPSLLIGVVFLGSGYGLAFSIFKKMAYDLVEPERRGRCSATMFISEDIGAIVGLYAYSFIANSFGSYAYSYRMASFITFLPLLILLLFAVPDYQRRTEK